MSLTLPKLACPATGEPFLTAVSLAEWLEQSAIERDRSGGTPKAERDVIRESGLLTLSIPRAYGGLGATWAETMMTVRVLARADSSIAHVYAFHHLMLATVRLFGEPSQWQGYFTRTVDENLFWGNALNPLDTRTTCEVRDGGLEFHGHKSFCSGGLDSDMLIVSARQDGHNQLMIAAIPTNRDGITLHEDWDNIGQRQTDSGSATFSRVRVEHSEILQNPGPLGNLFATLRPLIAQLMLSNIYLGIAEGAFKAAKHYTHEHARRWLLSNANSQAEDPYVLERCGEFWIALEAARALNERAAMLLDANWRHSNALSDNERAATAIAIATAKVTSIKGAFEVTNRMFDIMGARSTSARFGFDRYWRNLRTHSSHDPVDYKMSELGDWALNSRQPIPTFYS